MKIVATGFGDPQMLQVVCTENPPPGKGEVAIQIRAAGVNHRDYKIYNDPDYATTHVLAAVRARPGQTVLVHAASGGVGLSVAQLAALDGINVIGTAGEGHFEVLRGYGVTPVTYGDGLTERVADVASDGIDAAVDLIGTDKAIQASRLTCVVDRSRIATIVAFDRAKETGIQALGGAKGQDDWGIAVRDDARLRLTALAQADAYDVTVSDSFPLTEAAAAHRLLADGGASGRLVLIAEEHAPVWRPAP